MSYTITTTIQPTVQLVVSDIEYHDLLAQGLINTSDPSGTPAVRTQDLVINATGADLGYPLGVTGAAETGLSVLSSFDGGEDEGQPGQFDSTGRVNLYSYQRADVGSFGENIRRFLMRANAKSMDAWYMARENGQMVHGYDVDGYADADARWVPVAWCGAHWQANDGLSIHGHWSIEVPDTTGAVQTRLEVPFTDQEAADGSKLLGVATTNIRTNLADFSVRASTGVLRVGGANAYNKDILLSISSDRATSGQRWAIRANTTTEAGANAGTDFQIIGHADNGAALGTWVHLARATGNMGVGTTTVSGARVTATWSASGIHGFYAAPSATPGNGAAFAHDARATTDRSVQLKVVGDANSRLVIYGDGKAEWGDGTNARDTNLYRSAANVLKTDDKLVADAGIGVGNSAAATTLGTVARKIEVFDAAGASLGFVPVYDAIT